MLLLKPLMASNFLTWLEGVHRLAAAQFPRWHLVREQRLSEACFMFTLAPDGPSCFMADTVAYEWKNVLETEMAAELARILHVGLGDRRA